MKKFFAIAIASLSFNALADHHVKHMVTLGGYTTGDAQDRALDFSYSSDDADQKAKSQNIALNYAYAINNQWQVGAFYKNNSTTTDGDVLTAGGSSTTMGLKAIYNFDGLVNTNYLALSYGIQNIKDDATSGSQDGDKNTTIGLEFGHRFSIGTIWGMNFNYSPSLTVSQVSFESDNGGEDTKTMAASVDFVKFDVLF